LSEFEMGNVPCDSKHWIMTKKRIIQDSGVDRGTVSEFQLFGFGFPRARVNFKTKRNVRGIC